LFNKVSNISILSKFDFVLFFLVGTITALGFVVLRSATASMNTGASIIRTQIISIILGAIICIVLALLDYQYFKYLGYIFYGLTLLLLIYVLFWGYGREVEGLGSNSWISISGFLFQPSEPAKIAYMMTVPALLVKLKEDFRITTLLLSIFAAVTPIVLILLQSDLGTGTVFIVGLLAVVFIYGIKYRYLFIGGVLAVGAAALAWFYLLDDYQINRIKALINPMQDVEGIAYQTTRARIAIGSGKFSGSGLFEGLQSQQNGAIPVKESDFIFSVIGEELGFLGTMAVILLMTLILMWCLRIAMKTEDKYGAYMVTGLTCMLAFHFIENVGMNIGLLPVTGIPLPFISAGGSAMLMYFAAIGIIMSVSARSRSS
jgi:rod shape determining protein RodA